MNRLEKGALLAPLLGLVLGSGAVAAQVAPCPARALTPDRAAAIDALLGSLAQDTTRDLRGVVVLRCGALLTERYFNGADVAELHDIRSATKSITATLVGIAIHQGLIPGTDATLDRLLPAGVPSAQRSIRLEDLLTMRSGLAADDADSLSPGNENRLDGSEDWPGFAAQVPVAGPAGERYVYASLNAFLAGLVVERAAGEPLAEYARRTLFAPLGITRFEWRRGPQGEGVGQGNLSLTARDMARLGELFRNGGRWEGRQIVDSGWVARAWEDRVAIAALDRYADGYGYMWYSKRYPIDGASRTVHFASGNGGNKIYVIPEDGLVIAISSSAYNRGYGQRRSERILLALLPLLRS